MKNIYKKWVFHIISLVLVYLILSAATNVTVDKNALFRKKLPDKNLLIGNARFLKIAYLEENFSKYNAYLIGGSRIGAINPETLNRYIPDSKFYNLNIASGEINEFQGIITYLLKKEHAIKEIILQISLLNLSGWNNPQPSSYLISGENPISFYCNNLFAFNFRNIKELVMPDSRYSFRNEHIQTYQTYKPDGTWAYELFEDQILTNKSEYYKKNFKIFRSQRLNFTKLTENLSFLKGIKEICIKNGVKLLVVFTPENRAILDSCATDDYLECIKDISLITDFWSFSGYNLISINDTNYYDNQHFRSFVGDLILAKIFNDTTVEVPDGFGVYVTNKNIEEHLIHSRKNFINRNDNSATSKLNF